MPILAVRPFESKADYERMVDYFLGGSDAFLTGMGIDVAKMPSRETWLNQLLADHEKPIAERDRYYLAWLCDGEMIGHSSINEIRVGEKANFHLHLWLPQKRGSGIGTQLVRLSAAHYFERFKFKLLTCQPYAENPAPNRALIKAGFLFVKRYRTIPTTSSYEQDVNRYELDAPPPQR